MDDRHVDQIVAAAGNKVQLVGGAFSFYGWATSSEGSVVLGLVFAGVGLIVSMYFGWRRDRREQRVANEQIAAAQAERAKYERPTKPAPLDYYQ